MNVLVSESINIIWPTLVTVQNTENVKGCVINQICIMLICEVKGSFENPFVLVKKTGFCISHNVWEIKSLCFFM